VNYRLPFKLRHRTLVFAALITALLVAAFVSSVPPTSFAETPAKNSLSADDAHLAPLSTLPSIFAQSNFVSDLPGVALFEDPLLVNPWGIAVNASGAFWVVDNKKDRATIYRGDIGDVAFSPVAPDYPLTTVGIPNVPTLVAAPSQPTGVVANTTNDFVISQPGFSPGPALYIFVTANGGINAWNQQLFPVPAVVVKFMAGHSYTGVAIGNNASGNFLYVADFANGKIDVFDKDFNVASVSGNFNDPTVPANFHPYNIHNLAGSLYVSYAQFSHVSDSDFGFVRKFDTNGVRDPAFAINNGPLADPWGMAIAHGNFGGFGNQLLVGNSRSLGIHEASINVFNPATGVLVGSMVDEGGAPIEIKGLRALVFGNGVNAGQTNILYFSAGIYNQQHGLFGSLKVSQGSASFISFSTTEYHTTEGAGHFDVTVNRLNSLLEPATVHYATVDSSATQKSDYEITLGTLTFNPGEASKTFRVLIVNNNLVGAGGSRDLDLVLSNPTVGVLFGPSTVKLSIMDDEFDTARQPPNILDDARFFVRQQYFDFLNREPDQAGFDFWVNQITSCGTDQSCIKLKKINVAAAFFLSIEFQKTGMLAYLTEKFSFGSRVLPRYGQFMLDVQALQKNYVFGAPGAEAQLEANKQAFFNEFVTRPEFVAKFRGLSNQDFVNAFSLPTSGELHIAKLTSAQVVPPNSSPATGLAILRLPLNLDGTLKVSLYLNGLSGAETSAEIHGPAEPNANGPLIVALPAGDLVDFKTPFSGFSALANGKAYIDVRTTNFPNGEIRAQLPFSRFVNDAIAQALNDGIITRAQALRLIVETEFGTAPAEFNRAFVLMQYFGYLRRHPTDPPDNNLAGCNFWLNKLNQFNGNFVEAEMVKAFIESTEYRSRFGPP